LGTNVMYTLNRVCLLILLALLFCMELISFLCCDLPACPGSSGAGWVQKLKRVWQSLLYLARSGSVVALICHTGIQHAASCHDIIACHPGVLRRRSSRRLPVDVSGFCCHRGISYVSIPLELSSVRGCSSMHILRAFFVAHLYSWAVWLFTKILPHSEHQVKYNVRNLGAEHFQLVLTTRVTSGPVPGLT
jgi:hypothetical protein